jgi:hypothetical protein
MRRSSSHDAGQLLRAIVANDVNSADEQPPAEQLDEHLDEDVDDVAMHTEYRRLVAEQAALRRLGALVARGVEPSEVGRRPGHGVFTIE